MVHEETTKSRLRNHQVLLAQIERLDARKPSLKQGVSRKSKYQR